MSEQKCEDCGGDLTEEEQKPRECPYQREIHDEELFIVVCDDCYQDKHLNEI